MATLTTNLGLTKTATTDFYDIGVQNTNMDLLDGAKGDIDAAMDALETTIAGKAPTIHSHSVYGTCSTAAGTAAKTVALTSFTLVSGVMLVVKFSNAVTSSNSTLNVNSTGAKTMRYNDANLTNIDIQAGDLVTLVYDGTYWQILTINGVNTKQCTGTYVGTGTYGSDNPTTIVFDFVPKLVMICTDGGFLFSSEYPYPWNSIIWLNGCNNIKVGDGTLVSMTMSGTTLSMEGSGYAGSQLNDVDVTYRYIAFG